MRDEIFCYSSERLNPRQILEPRRMIVSDFSITAIFQQVAKRGSYLIKHVEDTIEQNDNSFDGIINNTPTVDELEAKVKAGEQISLVDLAEAIKADKERGKEKPSIRAQLKADKERTGKKKNTKQKSQDLERS